MKEMQSFLMFFYILDQCYEICPENDLGGFLGTISPELWTDGRPIDQAVYYDWKTQNDVSLINRQNITDSILKFLVFYENYKYNFSKTKIVLRDVVDKKMIQAAIDKTDILYQRYNYDNEDRVFQKELWKF